MSPSLLNPPLVYLPQPHPSRSSHSARLSSLCCTANSHLLSVLHMLIYMFLGKLQLSKLRLNKVKGFPQGLYTCKLAELGHESRYYCKGFMVMLYYLSFCFTHDRKENQTNEWHCVKSHDSFYLRHGTVLRYEIQYIIESSLIWC